MIYTVKTSPISNGPNYIGSTLVEIFGDGEKIGEYKRNYSSYGEETFCPFTQNGQDYALYSKEYTTTRVMKLPECMDLGGETGNQCGFCPVEFWIPIEEKCIISRNSEEYEVSIHKGFHGQWGFVAGCIWGDDTTWKIQLLDLHDAANGNIKRVHEFGYHQIPRDRKIEDAIDECEFDEKTQSFEIQIERYDYKYYNFSINEFDL